MNSPGNEKFMNVGKDFLTGERALTLGIHVRPQGTIIFPKRGGAIATNKKRILMMPSAYDLNTMGIAPVSRVGSYLWTWLDQVDLGQLFNGSNVPQINHGDIAPIAVPLPPEVEQARIVAEAERLTSAAENTPGDVWDDLRRCARLRQAILKWAFEGKLVDQDPADEPTAMLLERIRAERAAAPAKSTRRPRAAEPRRSR